MKQQNYEDYWSLTNAYNNYNVDKFRKTLKICVDFINEFDVINFSEILYKQLNDKIQIEIPKLGNDADASNRKAINQLVKLGFIEPFLSGYHANANAKDYLTANTNRKRETILSKIVYSNSKFNSLITESHSWNQINFLINTLIEVGEFSKGEIIALMLVDIESIKIGYLTKLELAHYVIIAKQINLIKRK